MKLVDLLTLPDMSVCLIENNGSIDSNLLFETERSIIKSKWSDVRKRTFTMGRIAAHEAMRKLGISLQHGEMAILADNILWHNAHPIKAIKKHQQGYWDVFVLTTKEIQHDI